VGIDNPLPNERYWLCPLYSFSCDCESIDLTEVIQIKPIPSELKDFIRAHNTPGLPRPDFGMSNWTYSQLCMEAIERDSGSDIASGAEISRALFSLVNFVQACRLLKKGDVTPGILMLVTPKSPEWSVGVRMITYLSKSGWFDRPEVRYVLNPSDVPKVNELVRNISTFHDLGKSDSIDIALRRFNSSYCGELEDRLIDQMIAFESLYIADDKELGYKLANRTAFFLGKRRSKIFGEMKKAYDLRGQIVHGNKKLDQSRLEEAIPRIRECLRQSIRKFLFLMAQGHSLKEIRKRLDENILKNGRVLSLRE